jgi:UDP-2-acetamido-2-deoxy-ribo-hexuluronate aminotransferase
VFVDIEPDTYNMDPAGIERAVTKRTRAIMPVDLFGQCADYARICSIARAHGLPVIEDAAQSFGAEQGGRRAGSFGEMAGTSFYPPKPLGCYGEGGMVFTDSDELAGVIGSLRAHGQGADRYEHVRIGLNARFDAIQAAVLLGKLPAFPREIERRQEIAARYSEKLRGLITTPTVRPGNKSVWAQYCVRVPDREAVRAKLQQAGVPTSVFYPIPLHLQKAFAHLGGREGDMPVSEEVARDIMALPMHPYLDEPTQDFIIDQLLKTLRS